nr:hypothetical protein [Moritella viscosa]SHO14689.1 Uncharacterized protein TP_0711 [Moritella viscosa]
MNKNIRIAPKGQGGSLNSKIRGLKKDKEHDKINLKEVFTVIGGIAFIILIGINENINPYPSHEQDLCMEMKSIEECNTVIKVLDFKRERLLEEKYIEHLSKKILHQTVEQIKEQQENAKNDNKK